MIIYHKEEDVKERAGKAVEDGQAYWRDFLLKILFTGITLGAGYKGGGVVPSFFVGATFGCVVGNLIGLPAGFAAVVGLICVFCGIVNCPTPTIKGEESEAKKEHP